MREKFINDKNNFYSKLFLYKTFLYRHVIFKSEIEDEELQKIIEALNIKNKWQRIEFIYDYSCNKLDQFYEGKNICQFKDGQCIAHQREGCTFKNGCCRLCLYQSDRGCTSANISCKLFYCDLIKKNNETLEYKDIKIFKLLTFRQRIMIRDNFFTKREDFLLELKVGLITFYSMRIMFRIWGNLIRDVRKLISQKVNI